MFRSIFTKILKHGRQIVGEVLQKQGPKETKDVVRIGLETRPKLPTVTPQAAKLQGLANGESILSRYLARSVTRSLAAEMRNKFALRTPAGSWNVFGGARLQGNRLSLYAFVGVGLAANTQWQNRQTEGFDTVCDQIRGLFKTSPRDTLDRHIGPDCRLQDFEIGSLIAKGCNAAVYEARLRNGVVAEEEDVEEEDTQVTHGEQQHLVITEGSGVIGGDSTSDNVTDSDVHTESVPPGHLTTIEQHTHSMASSIEIMMEEDIAYVTAFDPGGSSQDLRWRFEIVPREMVEPSDTGWTEGETDESIEIITESDIDLSGIPVVNTAMQDTSEGHGGVNLDSKTSEASSEQGMVLVGEWDIRLEDAVNLSDDPGSETGLDLIGNLSVPDPPNLSLMTESETESETPPGGSTLDPMPSPDPDSGRAVDPPAGLAVTELADPEISRTLAVDPEYNLAIKMMFNYDAESNAPSILRTMAKELVPAQLTSLSNTDDDDMVNISHQWKVRHLPAHPHIVCMQGVFVDWFPHLPDAWEQYPDALPERLNPGRGCGRNQTMFLVMKRYPMTLREYLETHTPSVQEGCVLVTQLVEAVLHMNKHDIAHRDMKSDNLLIEFTNDGTPSVVVSDFGCCTTEGMSIPYHTWEVDKGGNASLMAPEIASATPGRFTQLDYSKADLWAVGAIAYEIFGCGNPFYRNQSGQQRLDSRSYQEHDLPQLPDTVPDHIQNIIHLMLTKDMTKRPSASLVANMLHLTQWAPTHWLTSPTPSNTEVKHWLLTLTAEVICQQLGQGHTQEHHMKKLFLSRVNLDDVMNALSDL